MDPFVLSLRLESLIRQRYGRAIRTARGLPGRIDSDRLAHLAAFTWLTLAGQKPDAPVAMGIRPLPGVPPRKSSVYEVMELRLPHVMTVSRWRLERGDGWVEI